MSSKKKDNKNTGEEMDRKEEKVQEEVVAESMDDIEASAEENVKEEKTEEDSAQDLVAQLQEQNKALSEQVSDLKDRLVRTVADTENYKKRLLRDKEEAVKYANTALVKDLIGPLDDFSRAIDAASQSNNFEALKEGVKMIEDRLYSLLKTNWGLEVIEENNVPFNPDEHEACLMEEVEGLKEDTVTMMLQKGYKLNGRVIRPAKVKVGRAKS